MSRLREWIYNYVPPIGLMLAMFADAWNGRE